MESKHIVDNHDEDIETAVLYPQTLAQQKKPEDTDIVNRKIPIWKLTLTGVLVFIAGVAATDFINEKSRLKHHHGHGHHHGNHYKTDKLNKIKKNDVSGDYMALKSHSTDKSHSFQGLMKPSSKKRQHKKSMHSGDEKMKKILYGKKKEMGMENEWFEIQKKAAIKKQKKDDKMNANDKKQWSEKGKKYRIMEKQENFAKLDEMKKWPEKDVKFINKSGADQHEIFPIDKKDMGEKIIILKKENKEDKKHSDDKTINPVDKTKMKTKSNKKEKLATGKLKPTAKKEYYTEKKKTSEKSEWLKKEVKPTNKKEVQKKKSYLTDEKEWDEKELKFSEKKNWEEQTEMNYDTKKLRNEKIQSNDAQKFIKEKIVTNKSKLDENKLKYDKTVEQYMMESKLDTVNKKEYSDGKKKEMAKKEIYNKKVEPSSNKKWNEKKDLEDENKK